MRPKLAGIDLSRSLATLGGVLREDRSFRRLGLPPGWYLVNHYRGRLNDRLNLRHRFRRVKLHIAGRPITLTLSEPYLGALKGVFLDNEYDCAGSLDFVPKKILDLGANIGFATIYLATLFPNAEFALVEPDPRNIAHLQHNLHLNGIRDVPVVEAAVGSQNEKLSLLFGENPTCSTLEGTSMHHNEDSVTVDVMTLPRLLETIGWSEVDLLKVDIEGAEEMLFASATDWLTRVRAIVIEIHPNTSPERIYDCLRPYGFTLSRLGAGREPVYLAKRHAEG
jgi:FkbM family methyltransferase